MRNLAKVAAWMTGALASFVVAAISIRTLASSWNVFEINVFRTGGGLVILTFGLLGSRSLRQRITLVDLPKHLLRNVVHATGGFFWTLAISVLPLATVFSLEFTAPAWTALFAWPVLGERLRWNALVGLIASFIGTVVILRPDPSSFDLRALLPLAAALCLGFSALLTRRLTRTQSVSSILIWMMVIQLTINATAALAVGHASAAIEHMSALDYAAGVALGVSGLASQYCLSNALKIGEANLVMPLDFLRVPLIAGIGAIFYQEPMDFWVLAGAAIICAGVIIGVAQSAPARARAAAQQRARRQDVPA